MDLRSRTVFAAGHVPGSLNFGLDGSFATYLGWLIEWGTPLTLLGETAADVAQAQRELARIGIDRPAAAAAGKPADWVAGTGRELASFATATFADLAQVRHHRAVTVLDVRRTDEFGASRIQGAVNIPVHELPGRTGEVPAGEVWVHCAAGYRASIAASLLAAAGRQPVAIDDTFDNARGDGPTRHRPGRRVILTHQLLPYNARTPKENHHVPSSHLQEMRQDHLGRLRPARPPGNGRRPGLPALRRPRRRPRRHGGGWLRKLFGRS